VEASCGDWTNNACKSINHVLKQRQQGKPHMLPDLVDNLLTLIDSQYVESDRAICGRGDFDLHPHAVSVSSCHRGKLAHHVRFQTTTTSSNAMG